MKMQKALAILIFGILTSGALVAQSGPSPEFSVETHLKVIGLEKSGPPELWNGKIIFTYSVPSPVLRSRTLSPSDLDLEKQTWRWIGSGLKPNQKVRFKVLSGGSQKVLPLPLDPRKVYYVVNETPEVFQISETPGGGILNFELPPKESLVMELLVDQNPRSVALAFAHEGYNRKHYFLRNSRDVYFLVYEPRQDAGLQGRTALDYRFILDGLWTVDPLNTRQFRDNRGVLVSTLDIPAATGTFINSPLVSGNGEVEFVFRGAPGARISVVGSFNNWDPFMHPLREDSQVPGIYRVRLRLPSGPVYYSYMVGAEKVNDPLNPRVATYKDGESCSWIENTRAAPAPFRGS